MLAFLLHDSDLRGVIEAEVFAAFSNDNELNVEILMSGCPQLEALFLRCLRLCNAASSIRKVTRSVVLGGKRFLSGDRLVAPLRQLHLNKQIYRAVSEAFDHRRFLKDKILTRSGHFRPFGGGVSYCPGRFIARQEVSVLVVLLLRHYDIQLAEDQQFPRVDRGKPTTGLMEPLKGEDVRMRFAHKAL